MSEQEPVVETKPPPVVEQREDSGLEVRESKIEGAGQGLFATRDFKEDEEICQYRGTIRTFKQMWQMKLHEKEYVMGGFGLNVHVDAGPHPEILARYINDNLDETKLNARFKKIKFCDPKKCHAQVRALRDIAAGEEIYCSYGNIYWKCREKKGDGDGDAAEPADGA